MPGNAIARGEKVARICLRRGAVTSVDETDGDVEVITVSLTPPLVNSDREIDSIKALAYRCVVPDCTPGDLVIVNTLGIELNLGTGGYGFVVVNLSKPLPRCSSDGHIVKLRYTPFQISVLSAEEEASPHHERFEDADISLDGMPVVCAELHSALPAIVAGVKAYDPSLSVCYVMTDGGALPLAFSETVRRLKADGWLQSTVTVGHAFGGEFEAVNVFSGLICAKHIGGADVAVVAKGPGIVGTGTPLGHTGMEQGEAANAAFRLGGTPILTPRVSEADFRERHLGISHHFVSVLRFCTYCPTFIPAPAELANLSSALADFLSALQVSNQHRLVSAYSDPGLKLLERTEIRLSTMGRPLSQEYSYFALASASGWLAGRLARRDLNGVPELGNCWGRLN